MREFFLSGYIVLVMMHLRTFVMIAALVFAEACQTESETPQLRSGSSGRSVLLNHGTKSVTEGCDPQAEPEVQAVFAGKGELIWEDSQGFPARGDIFESVELRGRHLCNTTLLLGDGVSIPRKITPRHLSGTSLEIDIPWDFGRVDLALVIKKPGIQIRIDLSVLPVDQLRRQLYVNKYRIQRY